MCLLLSLIIRPIKCSVDTKGKPFFVLMVFLLHNNICRRKDKRKGGFAVARNLTIFLSPTEQVVNVNVSVSSVASGVGSDVVLSDSSTGRSKYVTGLYHLHCLEISERYYGTDQCELNVSGVQF